MARTGRNDPCPCGSGKKFKHCCESKKNNALSNRMIILAIAGVILAVLIAVFSTPREGTGSGRVWSPEHGHYHDSSGREVPR